MNIYQRLEFVKLRPGMYMSQISIRSLEAFISGYEVAVLDNHIIHEENMPDFHEFVRAKYNYYESTAGWTNMILAIVLGYQPKNICWETVLAQKVTDKQHQQSIDLFFELLDEFKEINGLC